MLKRLIDFFISALLLIFFLPISIIGGIIWLGLVGRPIIFRQKRLGKDGKIFTIYKLRSMVKNAEMWRGRAAEKFEQLNSAPAPMFKIGDDPRFIKIKINQLSLTKKNQQPKEFNLGKFLSHTGLDELPQLWNILHGEMAFFGPRPLPVAEAAALKRLAPGWSAWRHSTRPGIFSLWSLDERRHQDLKIWQKLEKDSLKLNLFQQYLLMIKVLYQQFKKMFFFWKI